LNDAPGTTACGDLKPQISVIIPARNEERMLPQTLASAADAVEQAGVNAEVIVVNDGSTDRTGEIALQQGARIVDVELHNIGAVRNAGARQAGGEFLFFLDADTQLTPQVLQAALRELESGAVGGGAAVRFDRVAWHHRLLAWIFTRYWQGWHGWAAGCFMFCRRSEFEAIGGFDEQYFAAEEQYFSQAMQQRGRFAIVREAVVTSGRKFRLYSTFRMSSLAVRALITHRDQLKRNDRGRHRAASSDSAAPQREARRRLSGNGLLRLTSPGRLARRGLVGNQMSLLEAAQPKRSRIGTPS
jgi:glycosyltransferase involved in cell wall biosynthesis